MAFQIKILAVVLWFIFGAHSSSTWQTFWNTNRSSLEDLWVLRRAGVNWWHFGLRPWIVNWRVPPSATVPLLPKQPHSHNPTSPSIHNFWRGRFTIWTPRFTTRFTTFWQAHRETRKEMVIWQQRSPFSQLRFLTGTSAAYHRLLLLSLAHYHPSHSATVYPDLWPFTHLVCSAYSTKITVTSNIPFSKGYLKYLTKKFLKKGSLRGPDFWWVEMTFVVIVIRVVHGSHFWAIFGSFSCIWQRNKQKGIKNDVKNGYCEHPGKENLEKCIFPSRHTAKKMKNDHFPGPFLQQQG